MGMNVNRWIQYAKARLDASVRSGNEELDRREADLESDRADRPWLASDGDAPTFEEAQARIRWEAETSERAKTAPEDTRPAVPVAGQPGDDPRPEPAPFEPGDPPAPGGVDPLSGATAAEQAAARIELDARARASAERLADIRRELGVDASPPDGPSDPPPPGRTPT